MTTSFSEFMERDATAKKLVDGGNLVLFFNRDGNIYGAPEESRVVFAKLKHPDKDDPKSWAKEATFLAVDLKKAMMGQSVTQVFSSKDANKIKVMDKEQVEKALSKLPSVDKTANLDIKQSPFGKGMIKLKDA